MDIPTALWILRNAPLEALRQHTTDTVSTFQELRYRLRDTNHHGESEARNSLECCVCRRTIPQTTGDEEACNTSLIPQTLTAPNRRLLKKQTRIDDTIRGAAENKQHTQSRPIILLKALTAELPKATEFIIQNKPSELYLGQQSLQRDRRLNDILRVEGTSNPTLADKLFRSAAQRSLALQYSNYQRREGKTTRVGELYGFLSSQQADQKGKLRNGRGGGIMKWVRKELNYEVEKEKVVINCVQYGIKQLVLEALFQRRLLQSTQGPGSSGISALTALTITPFKNLHLEEIPLLLDRVFARPSNENMPVAASQQSSCNFLNFIGTISSWYDGLLDIYYQDITVPSQSFDLHSLLDSSDPSSEPTSERTQNEQFMQQETGEQYSYETSDSPSHHPGQDLGSISPVRPRFDLGDTEATPLDARDDHDSEPRQPCDLSGIHTRECTHSEPRITQDVEVLSRESSLSSLGEIESGPSTATRISTPTALLVEMDTQYESSRKRPRLSNLLRDSHSLSSLSQQDATPAEDSPYEPETSPEQTESHGLKRIKVNPKVPPQRAQGNVSPHASRTSEHPVSCLREGQELITASNGVFDVEGGDQSNQNDQEYHFMSRIDTASQIHPMDAVYPDSTSVMPHLYTASQVHPMDAVYPDGTRIMSRMNTAFQIHPMDAVYPDGTSVISRMDTAFRIHPMDAVYPDGTSVMSSMNTAFQIHPMDAVYPDGTNVMSRMDTASQVQPMDAVYSDGTNVMSSMDTASQVQPMDAVYPDGTNVMSSMDTASQVQPMDAVYPDRTSVMPHLYTAPQIHPIDATYTLGGAFLGGRKHVNEQMGHYDCVTTPSICT